MPIEPKKSVQNIWRPPPESSVRAHVERLDRNERTALFTPEQFKAMLATLTPYDFVAYGELEPFYRKIAKWLSLNRENILLASGSDTAIKAIFETFVDQNQEVIVTLPNYAMFSTYTAMYGGREVAFYYESNFHLDTAKLLTQINPKTRLLIISNPSHTGTVIEEKVLLSIFSKAQEYDTLVLFDEAYHHFYPHSMLRHIHSFPNLIITRTFSKSFGLASLRLGLLLANPVLISHLYKVKLVHEIDGVAAKIGSFLLDNLDIMESYVQSVEQAKKVLYQRLPKLGFEVYPSQANFVFFKTPRPQNSAYLVQSLRAKNIHIKGPFSNAPFSGQLRVTVGTPEQMNRLCDEIQHIPSLVYA